jgi:hypothetical protein
MHSKAARTWLFLNERIGEESGVKLFLTQIPLHGENENIYKQQKSIVFQM